MSPLQDSSFSSFETDSRLEQFVITVPTVPITIEGKSVKDIFDRQQEAEGVVVLDNGHPAGIIMRTTFFQKMGSLYGLSLYMNRPISILMEMDIMKVDASDNIAKIGIEAMSREQSKLYDYIVAFKNKSYLGVISIRLFLVELSKRNEAQISVLKNQQQKLMVAHEQEISLRKNLEYQSASVRNLLDHADQGFLFFAHDLLIKKECSYKCMSIFEKSVGDENFLDLVAEYFGQEKVPVFKLAFDSYFKNNSEITDNVYLMLLPSDCEISEKNIHFEYRRIESDGEKAVMVILNDITEKVSMEKAMEDDQNKQRLIIKAFGCQAQIKEMLSDFREILSGGYRDFFKESGTFCESLNELFRSVHTFKGDFAQYGFMSASEKLHGFEDSLTELVSRGDSVTMADVEAVMADADPEAMLAQDLAVIIEILGESYFEESEMLTLPKEKLLEFEKKIESGKDMIAREAVLRMLRSLQLKNLKFFLNQYSDYLLYLSGRVMKSMPTFLVEGDDVEINEDVYGAFLKSLVHIFRNIMDHGIETDEQRLELGKPEKGVVECRITCADDDWFTLRISDDGRGINLDKIKEKALTNGYKSAEALEKLTPKELCDLIFVDHLSTKERADALSGRGLGMSAVLEACRNLGGRIEIETEENKGTAFVITLPYKDV